MVSRDWELRWILYWPEVHSPEPKPFLGIGPDDIRMARGKTMAWPYNDDGTMNEKYLDEFGPSHPRRKFMGWVEQKPDAVDRMLLVEFKQHVEAKP